MIQFFKSLARGFKLVGATGENKIEIPDNLASALDITEGSNSYLDFETTNGSELVKSGKQMTVEGDYPVLGTTAEVHLRSQVLRITPGASAGTNISIAILGSGGRGYNSLGSNATDLGKSGSDGSFALNAGGTILTFNVTENITGILSHALEEHDINGSSTTEMYFINMIIASDNIEIGVKKRGSQSGVDFTTIMGTGDEMGIIFSYVTSS